MSLFISEYVEGSSNNKAIELYNNSDSVIDLGANGYTLEFYFNGNASPGTVIELTGTVSNGDVFVIADNDADAAILASTDLSSNSSFFNGDDAIVLKENGVVVDSIGQVGFDPGSEWGTGDVSTQDNTLRRNPEITEGDNNPDDTYDPSLDWSGFPQNTFDGLGSYQDNEGDEGDEGDGDGNDTVLTPIYDIQGAAQISPLNGNQVTTSGIVTAVDSNGFYLQDGSGDGDNGTSDGIFVFTSSAPGVNVGDELEVAGTVSEFTPGGTSSGNLSTTQISDASLTTLSTNNELPNAVIIGEGGRVPPTESIDDNPDSYNPDTDGIDFFESLEGMLVTAQDTVAVSGTNRFGEIFTVIDDGAGATGISDRNTLNISPDDFNPEKVQIDEDTDILPEFDFPDVNAGDSLGDVTGVVSYSFGNYEINPTQPFEVSSGNLAPEVTTLESGEEQLTIASYNVLNLDPNDSDGDTDVADGRFEAIADDIVTSLNSPDIIALQEVQDNSGSVDDGTVAADETLQQLVDEIAEAGGPEYEYIDNTFIENNASGGQPGGNIRTAYLYDPNRVDLVEGSVETIGDQEAGSAFNDSRLPLVADFEFNGQEITVIDNHFSSKGGSSPIFGEDQPFEELQEDPEVNGSLDERQAQAQAVDNYVDDILAANPDANIVALGDLNEFEFISPVDETLGSSLNNLVDTLPEDERYSFIFQGNSQELDHILVSDSLQDGAEFDVVHVNSEFAETPQRASDHDPILAQLTIEDTELQPPEINQINGTRNDDDLQGTSNNDLITGNNGNDTISGRGGNDTIEGGRGGDIINGGVGDDILAADRVDRFDDFDGDVSELRGNAGSDTLFGGSKNDLMIGGQDNDQLIGKSGDDELRGNSGDDLLNGGIGNDLLIGGNGTDTADYADLAFNGVFGTVAGLDANLRNNEFQHSSSNNALSWTDTVRNIENVTGTGRNDRFIGNQRDNVFDGQGEVGRSDRQTEFTTLSGETYTVIADVVEYQGSQSDFTFTGNAENFAVTGNQEGTDTLIGIEFVRFNADNNVVATSDLSFA